MKNITLEMSLKPFKKTDDKYIESVCRRIFGDWMPLLKKADTVSVLLWAADGSEILDYAGESDRRFEWACYGTPHKKLSVHGKSAGDDIWNFEKNHRENQAYRS